jgi:hypothetical protein
MPALGDYLGCLMAEISTARMQADLATVRIAQLYASHPLLKYFSAPRLRLPQVILDIPVAVDNAGDSSGSPQPTTADWARVRTNVDAIIQQELVQQQITLAPRALANLKTGLDKLFVALQHAAPFSATSVAQAADQTYQLVEASLTKGPFAAGSVPAPPGAASSARVSSLPQNLHLEFSGLVPAPPRVLVLATTAQLKDAASAQNLTRLKLTITEEGVEWAQPDPNNSASARLVPE